jgi:23S rRNA U2552 (ribose-2'-O)-methylase RlmE/FtsJ
MNSTVGGELQWKTMMPHLYEPVDEIDQWQYSLREETDIEALIVSHLCLMVPRAQQQQHVEGPDPITGSDQGWDELRKLVFDAKTALGMISPEELHQLRKWTNRFECIGKGPCLSFPFQDRQLFINRSAIKLANINAALNFLPSSMDSCRGLSFVDLCGGPGGFTEYMMLTYSSRARGFGMSLLVDPQLAPARHSSCNWDLCHLTEYCGATVIRAHATHHADAVVYNTTAPCTAVGGLGTDCMFAIVDGIRGDGDLYKLENIEELRRQLSSTSQETVYVDVVVADGGVETSENVAGANREHGASSRVDNAGTSIQEPENFRLVLCQVYAMISTLREGGHFMLKLFDCCQVDPLIFGLYSVGMIVI